MKALVVALALIAPAAPAAHADLYRWIDPQSGSVKYSSSPPPWYGDSQQQAGAPPVEVIRHRAPAPQKPAGSAPQKPAPPASLAALEAQRASLMQFFAALPAGTDATTGAGIQQQLEAYQALGAELDRLDPAGIPRRRDQDADVFERLRRGLEARSR
jgi:hypothetical protein